MERPQRENNELKLYLATVIRNLITKGVATATEVQKIVNAVDGEDGTRDSRFTGNMK